MKSTNIVLLGIAIILFGAMCLATETLIYESDGIFEVSGVICPFLGLLVSALGTIKKLN